MDGAGIEGMRAVADAKKSRRLLKGLGAEAADVQEFLAGFERAACIAMGDEAGCGAAVQTGNIREKVAGGGVQLHAHFIHAGDDDIVEGALERGLIDIMLVLADADRFRIELHKFRKRIHETAANGDGATDGQIKIGELLAGDLAGRVDRGTALADDNDLEGGGKVEFFDKGLRLTGGRAIADGDGLDFVNPDHVLDRFGGFDLLGAALAGIDDFVGEELSLPVEQDNLATGSEAGVDAERDFLSKR